MIGMNKSCVSNSLTAFVVVAVACVLAGCLAASRPSHAAALQSWRVVLVAGDDSIPVFDNAVDALSGLLAGKPGVELRRLTSDFKRKTAERPIATAQAIDGALQGSAAQGCLVYLTSHGNEDGLLLHEDFDNQKTLSPGRLDRILDKECGERPTAVVVSACHSGVF